MPHKNPAKKPKRSFDVSILQQLLIDYHKDKLPVVVDRVCRMSMTEADGLTAISKALLHAAYYAELSDRKPLAVLARRLHDRLPRFPPSEGASSSGPVSGTITLASSLADLCEKTIGDVHTKLQHTAGTCSGESSFSGSANDENQQPEDAGGTLCMQAAPESADACSGPKTQTLTLLQQLRALQTFSACLYTQDMVSEILVHSIIDHVRYGSSSWPAASKNAAVAGLCDMTRFCGKRLETLGTLRNAMPDLYLHLKLLAAGSSVSEETKADIADVLELRSNGWEAAKNTAEEQAPPTPEKTGKKQEPVAAKEKREECFYFGAMLGAAGVKVEPCESAVALGASGAFPFLEPVESAVKMEDMLAAVRGMDM